MIWDLVGVEVVITAALALLLTPPKNIRWRIVAPFRPRIVWRVLIFTPMLVAVAYLALALVPHAFLKSLAPSSGTEIVGVVLSALLTSALGAIVYHGLKLRVGERGVYSAYLGNMLHPWSHLNIPPDDEWPDRIYVYDDASFSNAPTAVPLWLWKMTQEEWEYVVNMARQPIR